MDFTFSNLNFNKIILHNVFPPNDEGAVDPVISNELTSLEGTGKHKLEERITKVLGTGSSCIQMEINQNGGSGGCFDKVCTLIDADEPNFITESAEIANLHTRAHSSKKWPGGTLVVINGTVGVDSKKAIIIIKAERQEGFVEENEAQKVSMKYIEKLLLTPQARLYKVGAFIENSQDSIENDNRSVEDFLTYVFDSNITSKDYRSAARYFYSNFLGLKIPENAEQLTRDFYQYTCDYINNANITPEKKIELRSALTTYLKVDQSTTFEVSKFAESYLETGNQDDYENFMKEKGLPLTAVSKDITLIKKKLKIRNMKFTSNVKISAPSESFGELVQITEQTDEHTHLKVKGQLAIQTLLIA